MSNRSRRRKLALRARQTYMLKTTMYKLAQRACYVATAALLVFAALLAIVGCAPTAALCPFDWVYMGSTSTSSVCMGGHCAEMYTDTRRCAPPEGTAISAPIPRSPESEALYTVPWKTPRL